MSGSHDEWVALLAAGGWLLATALRVYSWGFALLMEVLDGPESQRVGRLLASGGWLLATALRVDSLGFALLMEVLDGAGIPTSG